MTIVSLAEVKAHLRPMSNRRKQAGGCHENGKPAAVLVSVSNDEELESILLACSRRFQRLLERSNREIDQGKALSHDEFWRRAKKKLSGVAHFFLPDV